VTGRWTGRGLCLTGRVRSVFSVCACLNSLIGRGGASGHSRPDASGRQGSLLDSNRTLALWCPVSSAMCPIAISLECATGMTSASGPLRDQRVRSYFARLVRATSASSQCFASVGTVRLARPVNSTSASGQRDCSCFKFLTAIFEGVRLQILVGRLKALSLAFFDIFVSTLS
jgi:hypothetical protein